jgi:hypothetical protein
MKDIHHKKQVSFVEICFCDLSSSFSAPRRVYLRNSISTGGLNKHFMQIDRSFTSRRQWAPSLLNARER